MQDFQSIFIKKNRSFPILSPIYHQSSTTQTFFNHGHFKRPVAVWQKI